MPKRPDQTSPDWSRTGPWSHPKMSGPGPMLYDFGQDQDRSPVWSSPRSFIGPRTRPSNTRWVGPVILPAIQFSTYLHPIQWSILCTIGSIIRFSSRERLSLHSNTTRMTITIDAIPLEFLSGYLTMEFWWLPFQPFLVIKRPWQTGDHLMGALWIPYSPSLFYQLRSPWSEDVSVHQLLIINNSQLCLKIPPPRHHLRVVYDLNFVLHSTSVRTHPICAKPLQDVRQPPPNTCVIFFRVLLHLCHPLGND